MKQVNEVGERGIKGKKGEERPQDERYKMRHTETCMAYHHSQTVKQKKSDRVQDRDTDRERHIWSICCCSPFGQILSCSSTLFLELLINWLDFPPM